MYRACYRSLPKCVMTTHNVAPVFSNGPHVLAEFKCHQVFSQMLFLSSRDSGVPRRPKLVHTGLFPTQGMRRASSPERSEGDALEANNHRERPSRTTRAVQGSAPAQTGFHVDSELEHVVWRWIVSWAAGPPRRDFWMFESGPLSPPWWRGHAPFDGGGTVPTGHRPR